MNRIHWPRYECHKRVSALKIVEVRHLREHSELVPEDKAFGPITVDAAWIDKHEPMAPGYVVIYEDGYRSWSPVEAFENGYNRI